MVGWAGKWAVLWTVCKGDARVSHWWVGWMDGAMQCIQLPVDVVKELGRSGLGRGTSRGMAWPVASFGG